MLPILNLLKLRLDSRLKRLCLGLLVVKLRCGLSLPLSTLSNNWWISRQLTGYITLLQLITLLLHTDVGAGSCWLIVLNSVSGTNCKSLLLYRGRLLKLLNGLLKVWNRLWLKAFNWRCYRCISIIPHLWWLGGHLPRSKLIFRRCGNWLL